MSEATKALHNAFEPHPDPHQLTGHHDPSKNVSKDVDYEPHPEKSLNVSPEHQAIIRHILNLYGGSASEDDMWVYAEKAIYDDPYSYCDIRYKIAGQWYGLPKVSSYLSRDECRLSHSRFFSNLRTLKSEVVSDTPDEIIFKIRHEYTVRGVHLTKAVDTLISLGLDKDGKVRYHKDMWNEKDYSHEGLGKIFKTLNGDHLTKITKPPKTL